MQIYSVKKKREKIGLKLHEQLSILKLIEGLLCKKYTN